MANFFAHDLFPVFRGAKAALAAALLTVASSMAANAEENIFTFGITGSKSPIAANNPSTYFERADVQSFMLKLASGPQPVTSVEAAVREIDGVTLDDLLRTRLVRQAGELIYANFTIVTASDQEVIWRAIQPHVDELVRMYLTRQSEFQEILDNYPAKSVPEGALAYILINAFSLDWDGLYLTGSEGHRIKPPHFNGGGGHFFWAVEKTDQKDLREIYWGSHNFPVGEYQFEEPADFTFTSFGDHFTRFRFAFPDIFWTEPTNYDNNDQAAIAPFAVVKGGVLGAGAFSEGDAKCSASILFGLRRNPMSNDALKHSGACLPNRVGEILLLLERAEYVERNADGWYHLIAPVFDHDDQAMIEEILQLSYAIMLEWHGAHYTEIKTQLRETSTMRNGVSYGEYYSKIWHFKFGAAGRDLARSGLFLHPYGIERRHQGFVPALWRSELFDLCGKEVIYCE